MGIRIGHGYDVHCLVHERKLILGGVDIPYQKGLLGHSDADVLTHAVMDAMLGALALGDIGTLFPDTDPTYLGISSMTLLRLVYAHVLKHGYELGNLDVTVLAQEPKLKPYIPEIRESIAEVLGVPTPLVSVKATTEEGLGFTGALLGIAAHAVVLLIKQEDA